MTQATPQASPLQSPPGTGAIALLAGLGDHSVPPSNSITPLHIVQTHIIHAHDPEPLSTLQSLLDSTELPGPDHRWLITLSYNLAPTIEPSASTLTCRKHAGFPHIIAQRCSLAPSSPSPVAQGAWSVDPSKLSIISKTHYIGMVNQALEYIASGDIYQVNLTHPITLPFRGSSQSLAHHLFKHATPARGSYTCFDDQTDPHGPTRHAIISLSPETFLTYESETNTLTTEPMKGTSPSSDDPDDLYTSSKDRAELNMIIDLMRNDLSKVSIPGSVTVTNPRQITTHHNSVHQATATVRSIPREGMQFNDILAGTFPPGSITGAPKIRAMQIIEELEIAQHEGPDSSSSSQPSTQRGPYCGSTIALSSDGSFAASVNIRTLHIRGTPDPSSPDSFKDAVLTYRIGAGIVADSDPESEWSETLSKAAVLESALDISVHQ